MIVHAALRPNFRFLNSRICLYTACVSPLLPEGSASCPIGASSWSDIALNAPSARRETGAPARGGSHDVMLLPQMDTARRAALEYSPHFFFPVCRRR